MLVASTPGWQETERMMVFFSGRRGMGEPAVPVSADRTGTDFDLLGGANPGTFYSTMDNVNVEISEGNPATVGVPCRYAQHCVLAHMDFRLRSGLAAIHDIGNEAHDRGSSSNKEARAWQSARMEGCTSRRARYTSTRPTPCL